MAEDRRIRYTKAALKSSLLELLHQKPLAKVSVKELCELADVNRGTFYAHYRSPEELMASIEDEFFSGLTKYIKDQRHLDSPDVMLEDVTKILEYIMANRSLCQIILCYRESADTLINAGNALKAQFAKLWLGDICDRPEGEFVFTYIFSGSVGVIRQWLMSHNPASPKTIAALIYEFSQKGLSGDLN